MEASTHILTAELNGYKDYEKNVDVYSDTTKDVNLDQIPERSIYSGKIPIVFIPGTLGCFDASYCDAITNWYKKPLTSDNMDRPTNVPYFFTEGYKDIPPGRDTNTIQSSFKLTLDNTDKLFYVNILKSPIDTQYTYDALFTTLSDENGLGYIKDKDLFLFGYDTAETKINENASRLKQYIDYVLKKTGAKKVNLIAHSQGNLIARQYIQNFSRYDSLKKKNSYGYAVNKFIMISPPNTGVVKTLGAYYMGDTKAPRAGFVEVDLEFLKYMTYYSTGKDGEKSSITQYNIIRWVRTNAKAIIGMIPTTSITIEGKRKILYNNILLNNLNSSTGVKRLLSLGTTNIIAFYGSNKKTISGYKFSSTDKLYTNGEPVFEYNGDDTVTRDSLTFLNKYGIINHEVKGASHGGICTDPALLNEIVNIINENRSNVR